jgi:hypothetical protein
MEPQGADKGAGLREVVTVLLLSITAILTAWTGFQASKWAGAMSIAFSQASSARIEATRLDGDANRKQTIQVALFVQWLQAFQSGQEETADFLAERFPEPLATAFPAWVQAGPLEGGPGPASPFDLPEYVIPELGQAAAADARADEKFQEALRNNQRSDNYTILTVGAATVLFFGAMAGRVGRPRAQWALLGLGVVGLALLAVMLAMFPKLV